MKKKSGTFLLGAAIFTSAFLFSDEFLKGVKSGLLLSANTVVPSLFVFMCASSIIGSGGMPDFLKKAAKSVMRLFALPSEAFSAVFLGLFAGYPTGAKMADELMKSGRISHRQMERMLRFCISPGIGFSVNAVGIMMLGSKKAGIIILISACISSLIIGLLSAAGEKPDDNPVNEIRIKRPDEALVEGVSSGAESMLKICGFVAAFSGLGEIIALIPVNEKAKILLHCFLEVTGGCAKAVSSVPLPMTAGICAFGGICIHTQIFSICGECKIKKLEFLIFRLIHTALSTLVCIVILNYFPVEVDAISIQTERFVMNSFSLPASVSLMFLASLIILDLDNGRKMC